MVMVKVKTNSFCQNLFVAGEFVSSKEILVAPLCIFLLLITVQSQSRAKPCDGFVVSAGWVPNQGQHNGIPPRIALPSLNILFLLTHNISSCSRGRNESVCAPCRLIFAVA